MIYILAGHTPKGVNQDPGAVGNGYREADVTMEFRDAIADKLRSMGLEVWEDDDQDRLLQVLDQIDSGEGDVICDLHLNAAANPQANGLEVVIPDRSTEHERVMASRIANRLSRVTGIKFRRILTEGETPRKRIGVMRENGINILIEMAFISNATDMAFLYKNKEKVVETIALALKEAEDLVK